MKKLHSLLALLTFTVTANCQPAWTWINSFNAANSQIGATKIAADASGGVYIAGSFSGNNRPFGNDTLSSKGSSDAFIAHYDSQGNCLWAQNFGSGISGTVGTGVAVDNNGDIYLCGTYTNFLEVDTSILFSINSSVDIFLIKMNAAGNLLWFKSCGGGGTDGASDLAVDNQNNLYMAGTYFFKAYFGTDSIGNNASNSQIYITKFNAAGAVLWIKDAGGTQDDDCGGISMSNDHFYIGGKIAGANCIFGTYSISAANADGYIARYDNAGTCKWVKKAGGAQNDACRDLSTDLFGNVYITGTVVQNAAFGNGISLSVGNYDEAYIAKYDSMGTCNWAKKAGSSTQSDIGEGIATDANGYSMLTGSFKGTASFGSGITLTTSGAEDAFIARFSPSGICQFALKGGGTGPDIGYKCAALPAYGFVVTGSYSNIATFGTNILTVPSPNTNASFIGMLPGTFTGIDSPENASPLILYPNPASDYLYIPAQAVSNASSISVINSIGQSVIILNSITAFNDIKLDVSMLSPGIYSVRVVFSATSATYKMQVVK